MCKKQQLLSCCCMPECLLWVLDNSKAVLCAEKVRDKIRTAMRTCRRKCVCNSSSSRSRKLGDKLYFICMSSCLQLYVSWMYFYKNIALKYFSVNRYNLVGRITPRSFNHAIEFTLYTSVHSYFEILGSLRFSDELIAYASLGMSLGPHSICYTIRWNAFCTCNMRERKILYFTNS